MFAVETMYQTRRISTTPRDSPYRRQYCECPQDSLNELSTSNNYQSKFKARQSIYECIIVLITVHIYVFL